MCFWNLGIRNADRAQVGMAWVGSWCCGSQLEMSEHLEKGTHGARGLLPRGMVYTLLWEMRRVGSNAIVDRALPCALLSTVASRKGGQCASEEGGGWYLFDLDLEDMKCHATALYRSKQSQAQPDSRRGSNSTFQESQKIWSQLLKPPHTVKIYRVLFMSEELW